jgi:hypothetical protein
MGWTAEPSRGGPRLPGLVCLLVSAVLVLAGLGACGPAGGQRPAFVAFRVLTASPDGYAGAWVCTEGMHVSGFEVSALGSSTYEEAGAIRLTEPVIWLEQADIRSRRDCFTAETPPHPSYEFCRVEVCGQFDYGRTYGHADCCGYQLSAWQ